MRRALQGLSLSLAFILFAATGPAWAGPSGGGDGNTGNTTVNPSGGDGGGTVDTTVTNGSQQGGGGDQSANQGGGGDQGGNQGGGGDQSGGRESGSDVASQAERDRADAEAAMATAACAAAAAVLAATDPAAGSLAGALCVMPHKVGAALDAPAPVQLDSQMVAQSASIQMSLQVPEIASTPNGPETPGAVGLPVWFWVSNPGPQTTGPNTTSLSLGDVTVQTTATFTGLTIDTGDGSTVECAGPGTPYPGSGIDESPDCGHTYTQQSTGTADQLFHLGVTAHWRIDWTATNGQSGSTTIDVWDLDHKSLRISDIQSVRSQG